MSLDTTIVESPLYCDFLQSRVNHEWCHTFYDITLFNDVTLLCRAMLPSAVLRSESMFWKRILDLSNISERGSNGRSTIFNSRYLQDFLSTHVIIKDFLDNLLATICQLFYCLLHIYMRNKKVQLIFNFMRLLKHLLKLGDK